jgi:outer membrane protein assembly factor BamD (BamD/ComL family)
MQEPARNLFKEKLNSLRTQLSLAIQDHKWREAYKLSETIIRDFPNTRIAHEVSERIDELRQRASETGAQEEQTANA